MLPHEWCGACLYARHLRSGLGWFHRSADSSDSTGRTEVIEQGTSASRRGQAEGNRRCYLIGFMGAGKTQVGMCLADLLGTKFLDLDQVIERKVGMAVARIFEEFGEEEFRQLEGTALRCLVTEHLDCVVATGGGTPLRADNLELMRATGTTVWLDPPFDVILNRLDGSGRDERPLFSAESEARALYSERRSFYSRAEHRMEISSEEKPGEVAERIRLAILGSTSDDAARA